MTHSWPNSIAEFLNVLGPLTDPRAHGLAPSRAFHVVVPSLPGFGSHITSGLGIPTEFDGWPDGAGPAEPIDRDLVLTNATLYWLTATGGTSLWPYYGGAAAMPMDQTVVPTGVSHGGPAALRKIASRKNDIVRWADHESPSHMVAMAVPEDVVTEIREFFGELRR
jgi:pimeloyl-ACP methyl ester carboxylesterase